MGERERERERQREHVCAMRAVGWLQVVGSLKF